MTTPVNRANIISAKYVSFLLFILIGAIMASISAAIMLIMPNELSLERLGFGFAFGSAFSLAIPTFMTPLVLIFGHDKNESILLISIGLGLGLFFGASVLATPFLRDFASADLIFRLTYFIISVIMFGISYLISLHLYKKKEF